MTAPKSPISGQQIFLRKPLQPRNNILTTPPTISSNPKPVWNEFISFLDSSNKENHCQQPIIYSKPIVIVESIDPSLGEELSAIKQKLERIKLEKEKTEKILKERDSLLDMKMKELQNRGEMQKMLEIEVDRLFRLKELQISCMRISPIRSLREKEGL
ncbi:high mobility group B protein 6-like [Impatiens glandulifera]|uniref:high mobility group B protein 6-like n=1 Tax=Impatiens glandulifera TaxID=253017 RepID=UPI001FB150D9|nr:high mobility group B protein 6-like [Impatiens glandulifera]